MSDARDAAKQAVAAAAAARVPDGVRLGLGSGTTLALFVPALAARVAAGLRVRCVPTSDHIAALATAAGLTIEDLGSEPLDLAIDGADEVDPAGQMVKGAGGALVRERIVAAAAPRFLVLIDESKLVEKLGDHMPLPVEIQPFGAKRTARAVAALLGTAILRAGPTGPFVSDNGGLILDCAIPRGHPPEDLARELRALPGVVDTGFFLGFRPELLIGRPGRVDFVPRND